MRTFAKAAALTVCAASTLAAPAAFAGYDEAGQYSFWSHQSAASTSAADPRASANENYRATYSEPSTRTSAKSPDRDPPYFYHAMGTMSSQ